MVNSVNQSCKTYVLIDGPILTCYIIRETMVCWYSSYRGYITCYITSEEIYQFTQYQQTIMSRIIYSLLALSHVNTVLYVT